MGPFSYPALSFDPAVIRVVDWPVQDPGRIGLADDINGEALHDIGL